MGAEPGCPGAGGWVYPALDLGVGTLFLSALVPALRGVGSSAAVAGKPSASLHRLSQPGFPLRPNGKRRGEGVVRALEIISEPPLH